MIKDDDIKKGSEEFSKFMNIKKGKESFSFSSVFFHPLWCGQSVALWVNMALKHGSVEHEIFTRA